jgi:hypothetical protein
MLALSSPFAAANTIRAGPARPCAASRAPTNQPLELPAILVAQVDHERALPRHRTSGMCDAAPQQSAPSGDPQITRM